MLNALDRSCRSSQERFDVGGQCRKKGQIKKDSHRMLIAESER